MRGIEPFFSAQDHESLADIATSTEKQASTSVFHIIDRMTSLQHNLSRRLSAMGSDLQPCWDHPTPITTYSFSINTAINGVAFSFLRPRGQAAMIEKMMGRGMVTPSAADPSRHPVLEVRLTPDHLVAELIMSPLARWDQRNFAGKMRVERHRETFRSLLCDCQEGMNIGFWHGEHLNDVHLTCRQILRGQFMEEWFGTFAAEHEWFRIGVWYEPEHRALTQDNILAELSRKVIALARIYHFFAWTSENNFHNFLAGAKKTAHAAYPTM